MDGRWQWGVGAWERGGANWSGYRAQAAGGMLRDAAWIEFQVSRRTFQALRFHLFRCAWGGQLRGRMYETADVVYVRAD